MIILTQPQLSWHVNTSPASLRVTTIRTDHSEDISISIEGEAERLDQLTSTSLENKIDELVKHVLLRLHWVEVLEKVACLSITFSLSLMSLIFYNVLFKIEPTPYSENCICCRQRSHCPERHRQHAITIANHVTAQYRPATKESQNATSSTGNEFTWNCKTTTFCRHWTVSF
jgi:hypothetical protein